MQIAHCVASLEARHGGPSVSVPSLAANQARLGNEVSLLAIGGDPGSPAVPGLDVRTFPPSPPRSLGFSSRLAAHVATLDAAAFHSHGLWLRPLHYFHRRAAATGAVHVISPRGMLAEWSMARHPRRKALAGRFVHPGALAGAAGWHATSEAEAGEIRARGFKQPICIAPNGVSEPSTGEIEAARKHWLGAIPEAADRPTALFYSRFHPKKRVLELIDLWVEQAPAEWQLLVVGIPETYSVRQLSDYVHRNIAGERIRVFDGTNAPPPYAAASLFLLPSHSENFGLVVAEALAHGLPAITTDSTPWGAIGPAGLGWCVPWSGFGATLRTATGEGVARLRERGAAARIWVKAECSWEKTARKLADFYAELRPR